MRWLSSLSVPLVVAVVVACGTAHPSTTSTTAPSTRAASGSPAAVPHAAPASSLPHITIGYSALVAGQAFLWIAADEGFFRQDGLNVSLQYISGGSSPTAALLSGRIQGLLISTEAIAADLNGADLEYVVAPANITPVEFAAPPSIRSVQQLRGGKMATTGIGTFSYYQTVLMLQHFGLVPNKDVSLVYVNSVPGMLTALVSRGVQAAMVTGGEALKAEQAGMHVLVNTGTLDVPFASDWLTVRRSYAQANPRIMAALVKGTVQGIAFEKQHPSQAMQVMGRYMHVSNAKQLQADYATAGPYLLRNPAPSPQAIQNALNAMRLTNAKARGQNPRHFMDASYVNALGASGFLRRLFGSSGSAGSG